MKWDDEMNKLIDNLYQIIKKKKVEEIKRLEKELESLREEYKTLEERILTEGDIITIKPKEEEEEVQSDIGGIMIGSYLKGDIGLAYEVWEIKAINATHLKLKRKSNYTEEYPEILIIVRDNYELSFAEDFVDN